MIPQSLSSYLPTGSTVGDDDFAWRHHLISLVLMLHLPVVLAVGLFSDLPVLHVVGETSILFLLAWFVRQPLSRAVLANVTSFALLAVSAVLIHFSGGMPEAHMHLLVMLVLVALYEDVRAYLTAVLFVVVHHIGLSLLAGDSVFSEATARQSPVLWSLLHAGLVVLETGFIMLFWKTGHDAKVRIEKVLDTQSSEIEGRRLAEVERSAQALELERRFSAEVEMKRELNLRTSELAIKAGAVDNGMGEINVAIQHMAETVHGISRSVSDVSHITAEAAHEARTTAVAIAELRDTSEKIEGILHVIRSIASKTNLLALNATIEAASAGASGLGFAVVAREVKDLAGQTTRAVADISETLQNIGSGAADAVDAINRIAAVVSQIDELQQTIAAAVEDQQNSSEDISRTIAEASADVARVLGGVQELASV